MLLTGHSSAVFAQETPVDTTKVRLRGSIVDENQEPIPMVMVRIEGQGIATTANLDGKYNISFRKADSVVVVFQMMGFQKRQRVLKKPVGELVLNVVMKSNDRQLDDVEVLEQRRQMNQNQTLNTEELKRLPSTTGNAVEELVATQAGVSSHNELSSQYNVRGGSFDENFVYINGVEIYRPLLISSGQQEGLSVINSDMVEKVDFSAGGFEAKYGDKMSSVLDITYHRPRGWEGSLQGSLLGANAYAGYGTRKVSFSNGLRYKTNQYMLGSLETKGEYRPRFLDYQAYFSWSPSRNWTFDFIGYISKNNYNFVPKDRATRFGTMEDVKSFLVDFDGKEEDLFRTIFGTAKLTHRLNDRSNLSLAFSAFSTKERETYDIQGQYWLNETNGDDQLAVGTYMEHARNLLTSSTKSLKLAYDLRRRYHTLLAGIAWKHESIKENSREWESRDSSGYSIPHSAERLDLIYSLASKNSMSSTRIEGYAQDTYRFSTKGEKPWHLTLNYGVRIANWSYNKETIVSPRASIAAIPSFNEDMTFRFSTGLYYQAPFYKELRDTSTVNGQTIVTLNQRIKSQQSIHFVGAFDYRFRMIDRPFRFTAEAYYKLMSNLVPYNVQNMKVVYYGENMAKGHAFGVDLKLYGEFVPGTDSWLTFSVMSTRQKINGISVPLPTDQRYGINLHFTDYFPGSERWKMTLRLAYADGLPFGAPHRGLEYQQFRAPAYKRADIGMSFLALGKADQKPSFRKPRIWVGVDGLNIFGISNVNSYYWVTDVNNFQYAVPNYLTGRQINGRVLVEF